MDGRPPRPHRSDARRGDIDSFSLVELLVFIEGTYGIGEIPQVALLGRLATADALAQYVADQTRATV